MKKLQIFHKFITYQLQRKNPCKHLRERQRETERDRERQRETETDRERQRETESERDRDRERDWPKFVKENFITNYFSIECDQILCLKNNDIGKLLNVFYKVLAHCLDLHAPYKKISKYKLKFRHKSWITSGNGKSIFIKNHYFSKFINRKELHIRNEAISKYKKSRNLITTLLTWSKQSYFTKSFHKKILGGNKKY